MINARAGEQSCLVKPVKAVAFDALRHRIVVTYEAEEASSKDVVRRVLETVPVP